ncbi:MAG: hypothetical protein AB1898_24150 [Acidobacteriota bacterium]
MSAKQPVSFGIKHSMWLGASRFGLAGGIVFATVDLGSEWLTRHLGIYGAYAFWALLFVLMGGGLFAPLVRGGNTLIRSYVLFSTSFLLYSAAWVSLYFAVGGITGEILGAVLGPALMAVGLHWTIKNWMALPRTMLVLWGFHGAGYFLGRPLLALPGGQIGMISWGLLYGLCLGAGMGLALFIGQNTDNGREKRHL